MASIDSPTFLNRAQEFFEGRVYPWYQRVICAWPANVRVHASEALLAALLLSNRELVESVQQGGNYFNITPFTVVANGEAIRVLDIETQGRVRDVSIWFDSAAGAPDPTLRLSTNGSGTAGNGIRLAPGGPNELGKVPPQTMLYIASDVDLNGYVIERG